MQLSVVSRAFRAAVSLTVQEHSSLELIHEGYHPDKLDSKLLLEWAKSSSWDLELLGPNCSVSGISTFVQHAQSISGLTFDCDDMLAAAQADLILQSAHGLCHLVCLGLHIPTFYPPSLRRVSIRLESRPGPLSQSLIGRDKQVEALLFRLSPLPHLTSLDLNLGYFAASRPMQLPRMRNMEVRFTVPDSMSIDLSWLCLHSTVTLSLDVTVEALDSAQQVLLMDHLCSLDIATLSISMRVPASIEAQQRWALLTVSEAFCLYLPPQGMHLQHLPKSQQCRIRGYANTSAPVTVEFAAVSQSAAHHSLHGAEHQHIQVLGYPGHVPSCSAPWQLCSTTPQFLSGLPGIEGHPKAIEYKLQNAAAIAAGW